jgi:NTE family protein
MDNLPTISPSSVNYLTFEGGGGKGVVYLGVVRALEEIYDISDNPDNPPETSPDSARLRSLLIEGDRKLIYPTMPLDKRQIKGISGTSAGAITAFSLAIGMSSKDLEYEANRLGKMRLGYFQSTDWVNVYEEFFEDPSYKYCAVDPSSETHEFVTHTFWEKAMLVASGPPPIGVGSSVGTALQVYTPSNIMSKRIVKTETNPFAPIRLSQYVHKLLFNRGLFSGVKAKEYFSELLETYLLKKRKLYPDKYLPLSVRKVIAKEAKQITFYDLFNLTGVDLVIVGTNVSAHSGRYFSVGHTPDFPVVDAVVLSMSMPFVFKPVLVNTHVDSDHVEDDYTKSYNGLYVDGGMAQNFPLHAFDHLRPFQQRYGGADPMSRELLFNGEPVDESYEVAAPRTIYERPPDFCDCVAGFNLGLTGSYSYDKADDFTSGQAGILTNFLGDLLDVTLNHGSEGQIRTYAEELATVRIDYGSLTVADFSTPRIARIRGDERKARHIEQLQRAAELTTLKRFGRA